MQHHFLDHIEKSWSSVSLRSAGKKVRPKIIQGETLKAVWKLSLQLNLLLMALSLPVESKGLQAVSGSGDVEELVAELSTEELEQLLPEQQRMAAEELSEKEGGVSTHAAKFLSRNKENPAKVDRGTHIFREAPPRQGNKINCCIRCLMIVACHNTEQYYRKINMGQVSVLKSLRRSESEASPSEVQTLSRRERTPETRFLMYLWRGTL